MSNDKTLCNHKTSPYGWLCEKPAKYEHEGKMYCYWHHPPNVERKREEAASKERMKQMRWALARQEATEQRRRAELFPELLEALKRIKETRVFVGAIPQEMMDKAIAKAEGES